jgi:hypothetical protein
VATRLLEALAERLDAGGVTTVLVDGAGRGLLRTAARQFPTLDEALRWSEDQLLAAVDLTP